MGRAGEKDLTRGGVAADDDGADSERTTGDEIHPSNSKSPREPQGSLSAHDRLSMRGPLDLDWQQDTGSKDQLGERGERFESAHPDSREVTPDLTGVLLAQAKALEALADLLNRLLQKELEHGSKFTPPAAPH